MKNPENFFGSEPGRGRFFLSGHFCVGLGWVRFGSVRFGTARFGSVCFGFGPVRF